MRRLARGLLYALAVLAVLLVAGTLVPRPLFAGPEAGPAVHRILAIRNPIHTDIAVPLDAALLARFEPLVRAGVPADLPGARYLTFGWGGRAFYIATPTWSDLKPGPLFAALTVDSAVLHVAVEGAIDETDAQVRAFDLTQAEFERLLGFIERSFNHGPEGPLHIPDSSYGEFDAFFEANGRFTALFGCNTWAAAALREAGLRTGWWNPLPQTLALSLDLYNDPSFSGGGVQP